MVKIDYCYDSVLTEWNGIKDTLDISPATKLAITKAIEKEIAKPALQSVTTNTSGITYRNDLCPNPECAVIVGHYYNGEYICTNCGQKYIIKDAHD